MFRRNARQARRLRTCPLCASSAVNDTHRLELADDLVLLRLRCGACGTWRAAHLAWRRARSVERGLERMQRRDRDDILHDLRWVTAGRVASDDFARPRPSAGAFN